MILYRYLAAVDYILKLYTLVNSLNVILYLFDHLNCNLQYFLVNIMQYTMILNVHLYYES